MMWTIFVAVLLLFITVNADDHYTVDYVLDPDDCAKKDLTDCTMEPNDAVCPVSCGCGYIDQTWNCDGGPVTCKKSCLKPTMCPDEVVFQIVDINDIINDLQGVIDKIKKVADLIGSIMERIWETYGAEGNTYEVSIKAIIDCKPEKGVGWMYIKLRVKCYNVDGDLIRDFICFVKLPCCAERRIGGGGIGGPVPASVSCADVQATMGPAQWCSCPKRTWPQSMYPAINTFKGNF